MSSPVDFNRLLEWLSDRWEQRSTICLILFAVASVLLWKFTGSELADLTEWELLFIIAACLLVYGVWLYSVHLPRCPRHNVGIAIAIAVESKDEYRVLASDFITALQRLMERGGDVCKFALVEVPQYHAIRIRTTEDALRVRQRCRCQFMIWGTSRLRMIGGKERHVLNLEGIVGHAPIAAAIQRTFSREFAELFPRTIHVDRENDVISLEFTSDCIDCVARYIIGIAAELSGAIDYAEGIFLSVLHNPLLKSLQLPAMKKIRQRTPVRLGEIYALRGRMAYDKWRQTEDPLHLDEVQKHLNALAGVDPANYGGRLLRAIYHFEARRNVKAALTEIRKCRDIRDATWRYSYAFLLAYKGEMQKARRMYASAFTHYCHPAVLLETEESILRNLRREPDKIQLHFCLGLLNWHGKNDKQRAIDDFRTFLVAPTADKFDEEFRLARTYLANLEGELRKDILGSR